MDCVCQMSQVERSIPFSMSTFMIKTEYMQMIRTRKILKGDANVLIKQPQ